MLLAAGAHQVRQPKRENGGNPSLASISHSVLVKVTGQRRCNVQFSITTVGQFVKVYHGSLTSFPKSNQQHVLRKSYLFLAVQHPAEEQMA